MNNFWIKLPDLPMEWWYLEGLQEIGDCLGVTLVVDASYKYLECKTIAKVLIYIKAKDSLYGSIGLVCGGKVVYSSY